MPGSITAACIGATQLIAHVLLLCLLTGPCSCASDTPFQIIFSPKDPIPRKNGHVGSTDYMQLFAPTAPWTEAARHVAVFKLYPQFVQGATDEQLRTVIQDLNRRGIAIGLEAGGLIPTDSYGKGVEGFSGKRGPAMAQRIKDLGGVLAYMDLDEPYTFGCRYRGPQAASMSMVQAAHEVMAYVTRMRAVFPGIPIGDSECLGGGSHITAQDLESWLDAYRLANGAPLPFLLIDTEWSRPGAFAEVRQLQTWIQAHGMQCGIIYDGDAQDATDAEWLAHAERAYCQYERVGERRPDQVVIQSWHEHPKLLLPESDPERYTHMISAYLRPATAIAVEASASAQGQPCRISGRIASDHGVPVPSVAIALEREAYITDVVPAGAATAHVALRVNREGAATGACDVRVSELLFDVGAGNLVPNGDFHDGAQGWGLDQAGVVQQETPPGRGLHVRATPEQSAGVNSRSFAVTRGHTYLFTVTAQAAPSAAGHGYVAVIFQGADGHEVARRKIPFTSVSPIGPAVSSPDGTFSGQAAAETGSFRIIARFLGDARWRPSETSCTVGQ